MSQSITFHHDGRAYELVPSEKWLIAEQRAVTRWIGWDITELADRPGDALLAAIAVSVKRARPDFAFADIDRLWTSADFARIASEVNEQAQQDEPIEGGEILSPTSAVAAQ